MVNCMKIYKIWSNLDPSHCFEYQLEKPWNFNFVFYYPTKITFVSVKYSDDVFQPINTILWIDYSII